MFENVTLGSEPLNSCESGTPSQGLLWAFDCMLGRLSAYAINAVEHLLLATAAYVAFCLVLCRLLNLGHARRYEHGFEKAHRVLFVTAHPDDECMFFGPTILRLQQQTTVPPASGNDKCLVYLLCMSAGDSERKGKARRAELWRACDVLGIASENVTLYHCDVLPDDPGVRWRADVVARIILRHVEALSIDALVTFDKHGVSRHSNHCSLYYAAAFLSIERHLPANCRVYTLDTVNLLRKYWLLFDLPLSFVLASHRYVLRWPQRQTLIMAMRQHSSQMLWFRRLYLCFSRYTLINTYQQLDMIDLELDLTIDD